MSTDEPRQLWERVARLEAHYETLTGTLAQALGKLDAAGAGVQRPTGQQSAPAFVGGLREGGQRQPAPNKNAQAS